MSFHLTIQQIVNLASTTETYLRGKNYFTRARVKKVYYKAEEEAFIGLVKGTKDYMVHIYFNPTRHIDSFECTCKAYSAHSGACKHVIATLLFLEDYFVKNPNYLVDTNTNPKDYAAAHDLIQNFMHHPKRNRQPLYTEVILNIEKDAVVEGKLFDVTCNLKIGPSKVYMMKSIHNFFQQVEETGRCEFTKNFTYCKDDYYFSPVDQQILDIFKEGYENQVLVNHQNYPYTKQKFQIINGKSLYLIDSSIKKLCDLLLEKPFTLQIIENKGFTSSRNSTHILQNALIHTEEISPVFSATQEGTSMVLTLHDTLPQLLTDDGTYVFYHDGIYKVEKQRRTSLLQLIQAFSDTQKIVFSSNQKDPFVSVVLPKVKEISTLRVDEAIHENVYSADFTCEIYFDVENNKVKANIYFTYGDYRITAFSGKKEIHPNSEAILPTIEEYILRDYKKENEILQLFEDSSFSIMRSTLYMPNTNDHVYDFAVDFLPSLQELASIYYSDSFTIKLREKSGISGYIGLNNSADLLDFSFSLDNIENVDVEGVLSAIRLKKRYYRLQDGSYLPLEAHEFKDFSVLMNHLHIKEKDFQNGGFQLPLHQALFINEHLSEELRHVMKRSRPFKNLVQNVVEPQDMDFEAPKSISSTLRNYQHFGFKWLSTLNHYSFGGILADDMGLGKTIQIIAFILYLKEMHHEKNENSGIHLIVAPTSLIYNWLDEFAKFAPTLQIKTIYGTKAVRDTILADVSPYDALITSYGALKRDVETYKNIDFELCIIDEAQHIKNPNSLNAKSIKSIGAKNFFALTGTPIENTLKELWSIFDFVMPGYLGSNREFTEIFEKPIVREQKKETLAILSSKIRPFILRREKKDVLKELPPKIETKLLSELTNEQKKIYLAYLEEAKHNVSKELMENGYAKSQMRILSILMRLRQLCCHPSLFIEDYEGGSGKLETLMEIISDALDSGHRILLFSQFTSMLSIIRKELQAQNISSFYLDGSTKAETRREMVHSFNDGQHEIFLISLKAGGTGLNLTGADMVIHFDPWWNPAVEDQATDRAYRIGQKNTVQVFKMITKGTIEEKIYELQKRKKELVNQVISPGETMLTKLDEAEIRNIFDI